MNQMEILKKANEDYGLDILLIIDGVWQETGYLEKVFAAKRLNWDEEIFHYIEQWAIGYASAMRSEYVEKYEKLYKAVDQMFYDISTRYQPSMDVEVLLADLRKVMYEEEK